MENHVSLYDKVAALEKRLATLEAEIKRLVAIVNKERGLSPARKPLKRGTSLGRPRLD